MKVLYAKGLCGYSKSSCCFIFLPAKSSCLYYYTYKKLLILFFTYKMFLLLYIQKKLPSGAFFTSLLVFYFNDFFLVVASASFANSVRHHQRTTFAAFY